MSIKKMRTNQSLTVWGSFLFLTLTWGSTFILIKQGLKVFNPIEVASIRLSSAMFALLGFAVANLKQLKKEEIKHLLVLAFLAMGIPAYCFATAQMGVNSSIVGVLNALTPLMTFVIGVSFFHQPTTINKIIGLLLGFLGSALLVLVNAKGGFSLNYYALFVLVATLCYGINVNYIKKYLPKMPYFHLSIFTVVFVGFFAFLILLSTNFWQKMQQAPNGPIAFLGIVTLGVFGTAIAQIVFNRMLALTSALFASTITYFIPIIAIIWGVLDGEVLLFWHYVGIFLIIAGVFILNKKTNKK